MRVRLFSLVLLMGSLSCLPGVARASSCASSIGDCAYYSCRSRELGCSADDYFERFGLHYCSKFEEGLSQFTSAGVETLKLLKTCLQKKMEDQPNVTCESALDHAYRHHEECYLESGFCEMSFHDKWLILQTVYPELDRSGFRAVVFRVAAACMGPEYTAP